MYGPHGERTQAVLAFPEMVGILRDFRAGSGPMDHPTIACLRRQRLQGLAHVHRQRIVRRDLNPSNILLGLRLCAYAGHMRLELEISDFSRARELPEMNAAK